LRLRCAKENENRFIFLRKAELEQPVPRTEIFVQMRSLPASSQSKPERPPVVQHLYVHIPFCPKVCPYCSFYKEASDRNKVQGFLDALLIELDRFGPDRLSVQTVFFGGGTPSALSPSQLDFLLTGLRTRLDLTDLKEWTLEMNPATVSAEKASLLLSFGVNRISMGVQSWDSEILLRLGRVHSAAQARRSYDVLRAAGFENVNLDLIFGVPGQSRAQWMETLRATVALRPNHISAYCLTYEEDTEFFHRWQTGEFRQNADDDAELFAATMDFLGEHGFEQYEISNYARPERNCLHNLAYWQGKDYLGLGPSAFSTVGNRRWQNIADTQSYLTRAAQGDSTRAVEEHLEDTIRESERVIFGLRTKNGVLRSQFGDQEAQLDDLEKAGYLETAGDRIRLTRAGRLVADEIGTLFV
jgi:oxygen-independent coproporphyrinogen-3 oxidase